jgi:hypothetical protein
VSSPCTNPIGFSSSENSDPSGRSATPGERASVRLLPRYFERLRELEVELLVWRHWGKGTRVTDWAAVAHSAATANARRATIAGSRPGRHHRRGTPLRAERSVLAARFRESRPEIVSHSFGRLNRVLCSCCETRRAAARNFSARFARLGHSRTKSIQILNRSNVVGAQALRAVFRVFCDRICVVAMQYC